VISRLANSAIIFRTARLAVAVVANELALTILETITVLTYAASVCRVAHLAVLVKATKLAHTINEFIAFFA